MGPKFQYSDLALESTLKIFQRVAVLAAFLFFLGALFKSGDQSLVTFVWLVKPAYVIAVSAIAQAAAGAAVVVVAVMGVILLSLGQIRRVYARGYLFLALILTYFFLRDLLADADRSVILTKVAAAIIGCMFWTVVFSAFHGRNNDPIDILAPPLYASAVFIAFNFTLLVFDRSAVMGLMESTGRMYGTTDHPNFFGAYCAISGVLCLGRALNLRKGIDRTIARVFWWVLALCLCLGVVLSGSRASLLATLLGLVAIAWLRGLGVRTILGLMAGVIVLGGALYWFVQSGAESLGIQSVRSLDATDTRTEVWQLMMYGFYENPIFGIGLHNVAKSESSYLKLLSGGGLIVFISMLAWMTIPLYRVMLAKGNTSGRAELFPLGAMFVTTLVGAIFEGYVVDAYSFSGVMFQYSAGAIAFSSFKISRR